jgi:hypothetical protein
MTVNTPLDPSKVSTQVSAMQGYWSVISPLLGGTKSMREAGTAVLPQFPKEDTTSYDIRKNQSTLLPVFNETVKNMLGRVFAEPIQLGDDVPEEIKAQAENIDLQGNRIEQWCVDWFKIAMERGLCSVLIDCPQAKDIKTKADEKKAGIRPYAIIIQPTQWLGFKSKKVNGVVQLTQFRYMESVEEDSGDFDTQLVQQVRVLECGKWTTYRKNDKGEWYQNDTGITKLAYIPLVTFYTKRTGFMTAVPPLMDVAYLNIKHYQSQSDQDNLLHVARVPILATIGADDTKQLSIGSNSVLSLPMGGDGKYIEHSGKAIEAGRDSLKDLVMDMIMSGAKLLQKDRQANKTVNQVEEEVAESTSPLQMMAENFEDAIDQVLHIFSDWQNLGEAGHTEVRGNFSDDAQGVDKDFLLAMCIAGCLSKQTLFSEIQRRGIISDEYTWEKEKPNLTIPDAKTIVET